jgi:protein-tyrosine phosphatase
MRASRRVAEMKVLAVCSANRCRSPMAATLLAARLGSFGVDVEVASAGFGPAGAPALPEAVAVMAEIGIDLSQHRSEGVSREDCEEADLIIGMTREHIIDLVLLAPTAWPRIFPLVDLVRRAEAVGPIRPDERFGTWVHRLHGGRQRSVIMAMKAADEIADPVGQSRSAFERTRDQLDLLLGRFALLLAPLAARLEGAELADEDLLAWDDWSS